MGADTKQEYQLLHKIYKILSAAAVRIAAWARSVEAIPGKKPEMAAMFIYAAAHLGMALVHEPFFDEAEAWQIARSASVRTLLSETTHYEGHPPLWHLILMLPAKAGAPYELSLTLVSLVFAGTAVFLILRYAPFPRLVRLLLPFTYFYFYQYGVISRVYCVMVLEFVLLAMAYRDRNRKPGRYTAALALLCVTSAYGIVIAGGLAMVWLWEIWDRQGIKGLPGRWVRDRRIHMLAVLLAVAVCVILQIMPRADTYAVDSTNMTENGNSFGVCLLYMLLVLPADVTLTDIYSDYTWLSRASLPVSALVSGCIVGAMIWFLILYYGRKKKTLLLAVLPYGMFAVFGAAVYMSPHHIGIGLLYLCFWAWASAEADHREVERADCRRAESRPQGNWTRTLENCLGKQGETIKCAAVLLGTLALTVSLFWTVAACVLDTVKTYAPGRNEARFMKEHHLEQYRIMSRWTVEQDGNGNVRNVDINLCDQAVNLAPYFAHNLFFNFNDGRDDRNYITHIRPTEEEIQDAYAVWREEGPPQVLWLVPDLAAVYGETVPWRDYVQVYRAPIERVWKAGADYNISEIYVRRELLEETGLETLAPE